MKNSQSDFDLLVKNKLSDFEIPPSAELKKGVFRELGYYALLHKIKKYGIYLLLIFLLGSAGYSAYLSLSSRAARISESVRSITGNISWKKSRSNDSNNDIKINLINETKPLLNKEKSENIYPDKKINETKNAEPISYNNETINARAIDDKALSLKDTRQIISTDQIENSQAQYNQISTAIMVQNKEKMVSPNSAIASNKINRQDEFPLGRMNIYKNKFIAFNEITPTESILPATENILLKKKQQPMLWSFGINIGHSLVQNPMISLPGTQNEDSYSFSTQLGFPSVIASADVRAEKRNFLFDFGINYSHFSEHIISDDILLNPHDQQDYNFTGQTMNVDTSGGYYHYYWICDSVIRIIDSVWTWKIDTSFTNNYDTIISKVHDTLHKPSWNNTYTFIEIPISVGWQYNFGKVNIGLKTGPLLSMLIGTKGYLPSRLNDSPGLSTTESEFKKFSMGLSWQISAVLSYFVSERVLLECQPYSRFTIAGIKSSSAYKIKNNSLGVMIGIRYYF